MKDILRFFIFWLFSSFVNVIVVPLSLILFWLTDVDLIMIKGDYTFLFYGCIDNHLETNY